MSKVMKQLFLISCISLVLIFSTNALGAAVKRVSSVSLNKGVVVLAPGKTFKLIASIAPTNATNKNVSWKSSKSSVASVDKNGLVKAGAVGNANVTVTTVDGQKSAVAQIIVEIPITALTLNVPRVDLSVGQSYQLKVTAAPKTASVSGLVWSSNKKSVATVSQSGKVVAVGGGSAQITVATRDGSKKISALVNVSGASSTDLKVGRVEKVETEDNGYIDNANVITNTVNVFSGEFSDSTDEDIYKVTLTATRSFTMEMWVEDEGDDENAYTEDTQISLHDADGQFVESGQIYTDSTSSLDYLEITYTLTPGTYYFRVRPNPASEYINDFDAYTLSYSAYFEFK